MEKPINHKHLLIRAEVSSPPNSEEHLIFWIKNLIKKINMKLLAGPYSTRVTKQGNAGLTGVAIIETSHIVIHTWDEKNPALIQLDVYSCKDFKETDVLDCLSEFKPIEVDYKYFDREDNFKEIK